MKKTKLIYRCGKDKIVFEHDNQHLDIYEIMYMAEKLLSTAYCEKNVKDWIVERAHEIENSRNNKNKFAD